MNKIAIAISVLSLTAFSLPTQAQQHPKSLHNANLQALDTNKSGGVSKEEYLQYMTAGYTRLDKDKDGSLNKAELDGIVSTEQFAATDANADGKISKTEYTTQITKDFDAAEKGPNGELK